MERHFSSWGERVRVSLYDSLIHDRQKDSIIISVSHMCIREGREEWMWNNKWMDGADPGPTWPQTCSLFYAHLFCPQGMGSRPHRMYLLYQVLLDEFD